MGNRLSVEERFWRFVTPTEGCWDWRGYTNHSGHGTIMGHAHGRVVSRKAHRVSYVIHKGKIPRGQQVRHTCGSPGCVNPKHLVLRGSSRQYLVVA